MELEAKGGGPRNWTPVVPVPEETIAVAMFQWKRVPITRAVIFRFLAYAAIIVVLCTTLAYAASATSPAKYGARSEVRYPIGLGVASNDFLRNDRAMQSQLVLLKSRQILAPVAAKYQLSIDELGKEVSASIVDDSEIFRVQVNDPSKEQAQAMAGAIVTEYIKQLPDKTLREQTTLRTQIDGYTRDIESLTAELGRVGSTSAAGVAIQAELARAVEDRSTRRTELQDAVVAAATADHVEQITQPYLLDGKVSPKPMQAAIAGFLLGAMLAAGVVFLLVRRMLKRLPLDQID